MDNNIIHFLQQQTCATICCTDGEGSPYCFNCYYAFNKENNLLYFKSSADTHHVILLLKKPLIAGTVLPDKLNKVITIGIQLQGEILSTLDPLAEAASINYHKKYPVALAIKGEVFTILLNNIKMKDSHLGFGNSILWNRNE
jgi:uncharacterized protein YhbP (UPF0306 family)